MQYKLTKEENYLLLKYVYFLDDYINEVITDFNTSKVLALKHLVLPNRKSREQKLAICKLIVQFTPKLISSLKEYKYPVMTEEELLVFRYITNPTQMKLDLAEYKKVAEPVIYEKTVTMLQNLFKYILENTYKKVS